MFFELRQYRIDPQRREEWVNFMEKTVIPFHVANGVVVLGSFLSPDKEDLYVWIRRFESDEQQARFAQVRAESEYWQKEVRPKFDEMMERSTMQVTRLEATSQSVLQ